MREGWRLTTIGEVCEIVNGGTPKTNIADYWGGHHLWITPAEMGKRTSPYVVDTVRKLTDLGLGDCSARLLPPLSVILSSRAPIGHLVINTDAMATNQGCKGLVPNKSLDHKFLFYYLTSIVDLLNDLGTGTTFKELSGGKLKEVCLPLPTLLEQKRIVAVLDEAFEGISTAVANAEKNLANARELFDSYLNSAFRQRGEGWRDKTVGELADHSLGKMLDKQKNKGVLKPYLRNLNVRWFEFDLGDLLQMPFEEDEHERYTAVKGDVLICEGGYPGRAAIWEYETPVFFQKAIHRVRFKNQLHNKWFLYFLYICDSGNRLRQYFTGSGIQHFTGQSLDRFVLPVPPLPIVSRLVEQFDYLFEQIKNLESIYRQKLDALTELKQAILHKAFAGELTAQPESVSLEEVAA